MTGIEDTHLTLTAILFQVGINNSLNFLSLQAYEKTCRDSVPVETWPEVH